MGKGRSDFVASTFSHKKISKNIKKNALRVFLTLLNVVKQG
jgi:hypothetical protein